MKTIIKRVVSPTIYQAVVKRWHKPMPVAWENLRQVKPVSDRLGFDRGTPLDRYYIEAFLTDHAADIKGRVLEIADNTYTRQFGGQYVTQSDVLHAVAGNPQATMVGDLSHAENIPTDCFDCLILTQVLFCIYDLPAVIKTLHRILKPGGVTLITLPGISQISRYDMDRWGDYWRFTNLSAQKLFEAVFPPENITVTTYGNVLVATAFLHGLAVEDLSKSELNFQDVDYQVCIAVRVCK